MPDSLNKIIKVIALLALGFAIGRLSYFDTKPINLKPISKTQKITPKEVNFALNRAKGTFQNTPWVGARVNRNFPQYIELITTTQTAKFYYDPRNDTFLIGMLVSPTDKSIRYLEGRMEK